MVNNLDNVIVAAAMANGFLQHPDQPQQAHLSAVIQCFFRAQGPAVTLELPLPAARNDCRTLAVAIQVMTFDNDFLVRDLARKVGLHQGFGPAPSVQMLLQVFALKAQQILSLLPMKEPIPASLWNTTQIIPCRTLRSLTLTTKPGEIMMKPLPLEDLEGPGCNLSETLWLLPQPVRMIMILRLKGEIFLWKLMEKFVLLIVLSLLKESPSTPMFMTSCRPSLSLTRGAFLLTWRMIPLLLCHSLLLPSLLKLSLLPPLLGREEARRNACCL
jgi:hypothetical protein